MTSRKPGGSVWAPEESSYPDRESQAASPLPPPTRGRAEHAREDRSGSGWGRAWSGVKLLAGMLIVLTISGGIAWGAYRFALTSPRFAVRHFETDGLRRKTEAQLLSTAGLAVGQNVFAIDTDAAESKLIADPWIERARVVRRLPDTLRVEVEEREATALALLGGQLHLVSPSGLPFKAVEAKDPADLPVITGVSVAALARDRARELERIARALEVLRQFERIELARKYPAQEVHLTDDGRAVLTIGSSAIALHLGVGPWRKRLLMAARVIGRLAAQGKVPGIVFLDNEAHPERVVVRMR